MKKIATTLFALVSAVACHGEAPPGCSYVCVGDGLAATAPHCGPKEFAMSGCDEPRFRRAVAGELVVVRSSYGAFECAVQDPNWLGFLILDCPGTPGDSGAGVFGADGRLLGVVDRNQLGRIFATIPSPVMRRLQH